MIEHVRQYIRVCQITLTHAIRFVAADGCGRGSPVAMTGITLPMTAFGTLTSGNPSRVGPMFVSDAGQPIDRRLRNPPTAWSY